MTREEINKSATNSAAITYNLSCCSGDGSGVCSVSIGNIFNIYDNNHVYSIGFHKAI
jgi:hypothetical protein